jgi:hypothetical protein
MSRFNEAMVMGTLTSLLALQSCITAEDPKPPLQSSQNGAAGGVASGQAGATSSVGGRVNTGGAMPGAGGNESAGGGLATGGARATGGSPPLAGGSNSTGGGVSPTTGGSISSGGCDFSSATCTAPCDAFAGTPATSWKQAPCQALLTCLQKNASCIAAADPLCGPTQAPNYAAPICGNDYYNAASDSDISTALSTYIKCICGF